MSYSNKNVVRDVEFPDTPKWCGEPPEHVAQLVQLAEEHPERLARFIDWIIAGRTSRSAIDRACSLRGNVSNPHRIGLRVLLVISAAMPHLLDGLSQRDIARLSGRSHSWLAETLREFCDEFQFRPVVRKK